MKSWTVELIAFVLAVAALCVLLAGCSSVASGTNMAPRKRDSEPYLTLTIEQVDDLLSFELLHTEGCRGLSGTVEMTVLGDPGFSEGQVLWRAREVGNILGIYDNGIRPIMGGTTYGPEKWRHPFRVTFKGMSPLESARKNVDYYRRQLAAAEKELASLSSDDVVEASCEP